VVLEVDTLFRRAGCKFRHLIACGGDKPGGGSDWAA
jgi:hypothetical protein